DGRVLVPPLALALGVDGSGSSDGSVSGLVGLVVASERDGTNGAVATTRVRATPVERHALVGAPRREHDDVVGDTGPEAGLTDGLDRAHLLPFLRDRRAGRELLGDGVVD